MFKSLFLVFRMIVKFVRIDMILHFKMIQRMNSSIKGLEQDIEINEDDLS